MPDYKIIARESEGLFKDRGSKFICYLRYVESKEHIDSELAQIKSLHPKARHFCSAYIIGKNYEVEYSNDDGEPSGSAGRPILGQLKSAELTNCLAVVVRYFGGTKLGVSGLINAYKLSTKEAIDNNQIISKSISYLLNINTGFDQMGKLLNIVKKLDLVITDKQFDTGVFIQLEIAKDHFDATFKKIKSQLLGIADSEYNGSFDPVGYQFEIIEDS